MGGDQDALSDFIAEYLDESEEPQKVNHISSNVMDAHAWNVTCRETVQCVY